MDSEDLFSEIVGQEIKQIKYKKHPSIRVLRSYLKGELEDKERFSQENLENLAKGELEDWMLPEVTVHLMTCKRCSKRVSWLKRWEKVTSPAKTLKERVQQRFDLIIKSPRFSGKKPFYAHLAAYAISGAALAFLFLIYYQTPGIILESGGGEVTKSLIFKIFLGLASAWGAWGITGLSLHAYKAILKRYEDS